MNKAERASAAVGEILEAIYDWEDRAERFYATGSDDDDVVVTHDSRGALIEVSLRPGLQGELTTAELEEAINDAIERNVTRAQAGLDELFAGFDARCARIAADLGEHPVATQMAAAMTGAG